ncbi:MAG: linoleoyl-CoA desaturase [Bacteroidia bacterium]|jgi:linoleoyl-CoA desaturase
MAKKKITFPRPTAADFYNIARQRVHNYFKETGKSKHANAQMVLKTIAMIAIYMVPYGLLLSGLVTNFWISLILWLMMGFGMAGLGLSVMHDANHGAYSKNRKMNKFIGRIIWFIGGSDINWQIQHNVLHHSFTNIDEMDEDIETVSILRFSPHAEHKKIQRFQHIYAWFFYSLMTIMWATAKDFKQLIRFEKNNLIAAQKRTFKGLLAELIVVKIIYYIIFLVLPMIFLPLVWWQVLIGFIVMHFLAGLILAAIFQPAHVMPNTAFPLPSDQGDMENKWAIHQLLTTVNYAPNSRIFSWYVGGLNYQVEHHLFPNVCHVHYKKISEIIKKTAEEFNLPYYSEPTFLSAIQQHTKFLKSLGQGLSYAS